MAFLFSSRICSRTRDVFEKALQPISDRPVLIFRFQSLHAFKKIFFSKHIENRVNSMISSADEKDEAGHVFIRVVFVGDKAVETRPGVRKEGTNVGSQVAEKYKYRAKGRTLIFF